MPPHFPARVYVFQECEGDEGTFLEAFDSPDDADDGDEVAIYDLVDVRLKRIRHDLIDPTDPKEDS